MSEETIPVPLETELDRALRPVHGGGTVARLGLWAHDARGPLPLCRVRRRQRGWAGAGR